MGMAGKNVGGYGRLTFRRKHFGAHRIAWELHHGHIPDGILVCHHCDNPACCNWVKHLFLGTVKDNAEDTLLKGKYSKKLTPHDVLEILRLKSSGTTAIQLAKRYSVGIDTIYEISHGKRFVPLYNAWLKGQQMNLSFK